MSKTLQIFLSSDAVQVAQQADDKKARTFTGIANSGKPFNYGGQRAIIDLSTLSFHDKVPVLLQHDRDSRVGFGTLKVEHHQLLIDGTLLENEQAQKIAQDADDGFPFQMSAHVQAGSTEELTGNQTAEVNGQTITAPILILRHCFIPEVSFTPTGVDNQTSAIVLSDDPTSNPKAQPSKGEHMNETEQLKAELEKVKADNAQKDELIKQLQDEKQKAEAEAKKTAVEAELSNKGFTKEDKGVWQGISSTTVDVLLSTDVEKAKTMIADLAQTNKPNIPDFLLSEQHQAGQQQSTGNVLLDNAVARQQAQQSYI